jgi:mannose-6-phosphate isomerase
MPMVLEPLLFAKVWGGRKLAHWGKAVAHGRTIGESWELADLDTTSSSGGGGNAAHSRVLSGSGAGETIRVALDRFGDDLIDRRLLTSEGRFPLLIKLLDAREHLSIQVHPSRDYAIAHPDAKLKTECWHILETQSTNGVEPVIFKGTKPGVSKRDIERALRTGDGSDLVPLLQAFPARVGDCHTLPSGTIHALGAGVLVAEVQTPSDTTFRLYDWTREYQRPLREMHVDQALQAMVLDVPPPVRRLEPGHRHGIVAETPYFHLAAVQGPCDLSAASRADEGACAMVFAGDSDLAILAGTSETPVPRGATSLVPRKLLANARVRCDVRARYLVATPRDPR